MNLLISFRKFQSFVLIYNSVALELIIKVEYGPRSWEVENPSFFIINGDISHANLGSNILDTILLKWYMWTTISAFRSSNNLLLIFKLITFHS